MKKEHGEELTTALETVLSVLGYENLEKYGGENGLTGVPLCFWLRTLCGIGKVAERGRRPAPEVLYFPFPENKYLIQALLALCCFFARHDQKRHPLAVERICDGNRTGEYLFLEVGEEQVVLVDRVRLHHLRLAASNVRRVSLVMVFLSKKSRDIRGSLENHLIVVSRPGRGKSKTLLVRRILAVPASELLNGLFRLRKVQALRSIQQQHGEQDLPPEELNLRTILLPSLLRQTKQARGRPMHRARIVELQA